MLIYIVLCCCTYIGKEAQCVNKDSTISDKKQKESQYLNRRDLHKDIKYVIAMEQRIAAIEEKYMKSTSPSQREIHFGTTNFVLYELGKYVVCFKSMLYNPVSFASMLCNFYSLKIILIINRQGRNTSCLCMSLQTKR